MNIQNSQKAALFALMADGCMQTLAVNVRRVAVRAAADVDTADFTGQFMAVERAAGEAVETRPCVSSEQGPAVSLGQQVTLEGCSLPWAWLGPAKIGTG